MKFRRGDLWWADLNPTLGTEPGKRRPVVVVQSNLLNKAAHRSTIICPITTRLVQPPNLLRVRLPATTTGLPQESEILVDQIRAVDNRRLQRVIGQLPLSLMTELSDKLSFLLDLKI